MNFRVVTSGPAKRDIASAARWWAEHRSAGEAARWLRGVDRLIDDLEDHPLGYPETEERFETKEVIREALFGLGRGPTHRVFFRVAEDMVTVLHVRHMAQSSPTDRDLGL